MTEEQLHAQIVDYIKYMYPDVIFNTDASGIKLTIGQAVKMAKLRSDNGFPDIAIYEPNKEYRALFFEVKKETPYKVNGELKAMKRKRTVNGIIEEYDHLQEQNNMHIKLRARGYRVEFIWSLKMAIKELNDYFQINTSH